MRRASASVPWTAPWLGLALLLGCPADKPAKVVPRDGRLGAQRCSGQPAAKAPRLPVLQRPFDGQHPVLNVFDHDVPVSGEIRPDAEGDSELSYCGVEVLGLANGFPGYAFGMPEGTPVLAAADGEVIAGGQGPPFVCPLTLRRVDDQLAVDVRHDGLGGVGFLTRYVHLSRVLVKAGDQVVAGQRLGLSGRSGCALRPLLYFEVKRMTGTKTGQTTVVDPYGWDGPGPDPWAQHERGAASVYLWKDGEAPTLRAR